MARTGDADLQKQVQGLREEVISGLKSARARVCYAGPSRASRY